MGTHVGAYCIRPLRVYRLPFRPLQGVLGAYAIRPYPAGRKIGFEGLVGGYVWGKGGFFDKEDEKRKDFLAGG